MKTVRNLDIETSKGIIYLFESLEVTLTVREQ
jgi:hypothetical protein